jgi:hypothetical protein
MIDSEQSYFLKMADMQGSVFEEKGDGYVEFSVIVPQKGPLYAYFKRNSKEAKMTINGDYEIKLFTGETDCVQFLGYYEAGETVIVRLESDKVKVGADAFYLLDETAFGKAMTTLKENSLKIERLKTRVEQYKRSTDPAKKAAKKREIVKDSFGLAATALIKSPIMLTSKVLSAVGPLFIGVMLLPADLVNRMLACFADNYNGVSRHSADYSDTFVSQISKSLREGIKTISQATYQNVGRM